MAYTRSSTQHRVGIRPRWIVLYALAIFGLTVSPSQSSAASASSLNYLDRYKKAIAPIYKDLGTAQAIALCRFRDAGWLSDIMTRLANEEDGRGIQYLKSKMSLAELDIAKNFSTYTVIKVRNYYVSNNPRDLKSCLIKIRNDLVRRFDLYREGRILFVSARPAPQSVPRSFRVQPTLPPVITLPPLRPHVEEHRGID